MVEPGFDAVGVAFLRWKAAVEALREAEQRPDTSSEELARLRREEEHLLLEATSTLRERTSGAPLAQ